MPTRLKYYKYYSCFFTGLGIGLHDTKIKARSSRPRPGPRDQYQDQMALDQDQYRMFQDQDRMVRDQDHQKTASSGLETETAISWTTTLVLEPSVPELSQASETRVRFRILLN